MAKGSHSADYIVFGKRGQVGCALCSLLGKKVFGVSHKDIDYQDRKKIYQFLDAKKPRVIINAAAYTQVDQAEMNEEDALFLNAVWPDMLADYCQKNDILFVHYSTDYVFDGSGDAAWQEDDVPGPLNVYGCTKLAGDQAVIDRCKSALILRVSWVYDAAHNNFFTAMARLATERKNLSIVDDQIGAPTYAPFIAEMTLRLVDNILKDNSFKSTIYHLAPRGEVSRLDFAQQIFAGLKKAGYALQLEEIMPISSQEYQTAALRPCNSRMDTGKLCHSFDVTLPDWDQGLQQCLKDYVELQTV